MKKRLKVLALVLVSASFIGGIPVQQDGVYSVSINFSGKGYTFYPPSGGMQYNASEYIERFGAFPTMPLWTNVDADSMTLSLRLLYSAEPAWQKRFEPWDPIPKWSDYKDNLVLILESVKSGTRDTLTWGSISTGIVNVPSDPFFGNQIEVDADVDAFSLPIPQDGSAWRVWTELWDEAGQPATRVDTEQDTVILVRTPLETAADSLMYMGAVSAGDTAFFHTVQRAFPTNFAVTSMLFDFYYLDENCDSVSALGNRMFAIWDTSSVPRLVSDDFNPEAVILEKMNDICVDGHAQPEKYSGLFRAED
ncbi:hypothetical protein KQI52_13380 [bacterium]|nr:hypothetical protein [bacterium]